MADPLSSIDGTDRPSNVIMPDRMFDGTLTVRSVASTGLFVLAIFYTLHLGRVVFLPIVIAVLFTALLAPLLRKLKRIRIPEPVGQRYCCRQWSSYSGPLYPDSQSRRGNGPPERRKPFAKQNTSFAC